MTQGGFAVAKDVTNTVPFKVFDFEFPSLLLWLYVEYDITSLFNELSGSANPLTLDFLGSKI